MAVFRMPLCQRLVTKVICESYGSKRSETRRIARLELQMRDYASTRQDVLRFCGWRPVNSTTVRYQKDGLRKNVGVVTGAANFG